MEERNLVLKNTEDNPADWIELFVKDPARKDARKQIIDAANQFRKINENGKKPFTSRNINEAVCIVRRNGLIDDIILVEAGFNGLRLSKNVREVTVRIVR